MKKKVLGISLVVALLAIMVGGTLAYFTAEDEVTNTFTIGSVKIEVVEDFQEPEIMVPVVNANESDPNYINKDASVKNIGDNDAYVQMFVAIPKALDDVGAFIVVDMNESDWTDRQFAGTATIEEVLCNVYQYRHTEILEPGWTTSDVITAAYLAPELDYDHETNRFVMNGNVIENYIPGESINIYVAAQAIQAAGFDGYDSALNNFTGNPWATN